MPPGRQRALATQVLSLNKQEALKHSRTRKEKPTTGGEGDAAEEKKHELIRTAEMSLPSPSSTTFPLSLVTTSF